MSWLHEESSLLSITSCQINYRLSQWARPTGYLSDQSTIYSPFRDQPRYRAELQHDAPANNEINVKHARHLLKGTKLESDLPLAKS